MANPEHLAILEQGVEAWNGWRAENPAVTPDLNGAFGPQDKPLSVAMAHFQTADLGGNSLARSNFTFADLTGADLRDSNLTGADLRSAVLRSANLSSGGKSRPLIRRGRAQESLVVPTAELREGDLILGKVVIPTTTLREADLRMADLTNANLEGCDLSGADLRWTKLRGANLFRASIQRANLTESVFGWTLLASTEMAGATGLGSIHHEGPSSLGLDTVARGEGIFSSQFLRGCGVEERIVEYLPSILSPGAIRFYTAFISYSHADKPFARRLHDQLQGQGIRCWLDERQLKIGEEILPGVLDAIRLHDRVILCCSEASLTSNWVQSELEETFTKEKEEGRPILLPLNLDGYLFDGWKGPLAVEVRKRLAADFTGWETDNAKFEEQFERVVEALRAEGTGGVA